jgi:hypothetical protein
MARPNTNTQAAPNAAAPTNGNGKTASERAANLAAQIVNTAPAPEAPEVTSAPATTPDAAAPEAAPAAPAEPTWSSSNKPGALHAGLFTTIESVQADVLDFVTKAATGAQIDIPAGTQIAVLQSLVGPDGAIITRQGLLVGAAPAYVNIPGTAFPGKKAPVPTSPEDAARQAARTKLMTSAGKAALRGAYLAYLRAAHTQLDKQLAALENTAKPMDAGAAEALIHEITTIWNVELFNTVQYVNRAGGYVTGSTQAAEWAAKPVANTPAEAATALAAARKARATKPEADGAAPAPTSADAPAPDAAP